MISYDSVYMVKRIEGANTNILGVFHKMDNAELFIPSRHRVSRTQISKSQWRFKDSTVDDVIYMIEVHNILDSSGVPVMPVE